MRFEPVGAWRANELWPDIGLRHQLIVEPAFWRACACAGPLAGDGGVGPASNSYGRLIGVNKAFEI